MPVPEQLKQRLEDDKRRLEVEIADVAARPNEYRETEDSFYGNHLADSATETFEEEKAVALEAHLCGLLNQVESALSRMANGTYGICESCGKPIAIERLEALPYATTCLACASNGKRTRAA
jgi:RNA polymerase-binding protein DksA